MPRESLAGPAAEPATTVPCIRSSGAVEGSTMRNPNVVILAALLLLPATVASAADSTWPQWRGPQRDGSVVRDRPWPDDLGHLRPVWSSALGKGYPGPIVGPERVYVVETVDDRTEGARAFDRAAGKELWQARWPGHGKVPFFAARNGDWIRSTPAFDGATLFVGGMSETLVALDTATGAERWRFEAPERFGTAVPDFGFASSPLVDGDALYVQAADSMLKLDKTTGKTIWRALVIDSDMMSRGAFSSPVIAEVGGRRQLLVQTRQTLYGLDPESGAPLWQHDVPSFRGMNILTPVVHGEGVFTSTYRNRSYFYRIAAGEAGFEASESWTHKAQAYMSTPILVGDHAYLHLGNGRLTAIDLTTGSETWTTSERFGDYWSMATDGDKILGLASDGRLYLLRADPTAFTLLDQREVSDQESWAHLAVAGDDVYVRSLEGVQAFRWSTADAADTDAAVAAAEGGDAPVRDVR